MAFTALGGASGGEAQLADRPIDINLKKCYNIQDIFNKKRIVSPSYFL
ncbi:hypothetical protein QT971_21830 [Microcoleus sp. herbarium19]